MTKNQSISDGCIERLWEKARGKTDQTLVLADDLRELLIAYSKLEAKCRP
jgi:hypothetical protein